MKKLLIICFVMSAALCNGQRKFDLDSLGAKIATMDDGDSNKVTLMNQLAWDISYADLDSGLQIVTRSVELARETGFKIGESEALNVQGTIFADLGRYPEAVNAHLLAIRLREFENNPAKLGESYHNLALVYHSMDSVQTSLHYQHLAFHYYGFGSDTSGLAPIGSYIGNAFVDMDSCEAAIKFFERGLSVARDYKMKHWIAENMGGLAYCHAWLGDTAKANQIMKEAFDVAKSENNEYDMMSTWANVARLKKLEKNYSGAIAAIDSALSISTKLNVRDSRMDHLKLLAELHEVAGNDVEALLYAHQFQMLKDSILSTKNQQNIRNLEAVYEKEKQEQQLELLREDDRLQKILVGGGIVFTLGFIVVAFLLFGRIKMGRKAGQILNEKKAIIESKNKDIIDSITYARRIQDAVSPVADQLRSVFSSAFVYNRPREIVSGDFWWTAETHDSYFIAAGDCSGHGVPGSFMSVMAASFLNGIVIEHEKHSPDEILFELNKKVRAALQHSGTTENVPLVTDTIDIAVCRITKSKREISFSSAVMPVIIVHADNLVEYRGSEYSVGSVENPNDNPFTLTRATLAEGNSVFLFSDGLSAMTQKDLKADALNDLVIQLSQSTAPEKKLDSYVHDTYSGTKPEDDILIVGIRI